MKLLKRLSVLALTAALTLSMAAPAHGCWFRLR